MSSMIKYKGYHASVEYDAEDDLFIGEVFGIADSLNFYGTSVDEMKEMFKQSINNYLLLCEKSGKIQIKNLKVFLMFVLHQKCIKEQPWRLQNKNNVESICHESN